MKRISLAVFLFFFYCSCNNIDRLSLYEDAFNKYYVKFERLENQKGIDTLCTFYDFNKPKEIMAVGFYRDGFRNGLWNYNLPDQVKSINWAYYKDKYLGFETNLFDQADSTTYSDFYTQFLFKKEQSEISLGISINSPAKDLFSKNDFSGYKTMVQNDFNNMGFKMLQYSDKNIMQEKNQIYVADVVGKAVSNGNTKYIKTALSFLDKDHFVAISISSNKDDFYMNVLFNAVLTNFSINGDRLYDPFVHDKIQ